MIWLSKSLGCWIPKTEYEDGPGRDGQILERYNQRHDNGAFSGPSGQKILSFNRFDLQLKVHNQISVRVGSEGFNGEFRP
jgi:hypothetical protein